MKPKKTGEKKQQGENRRHKKKKKEWQGDKECTERKGGRSKIRKKRKRKNEVMKTWEM